MSIPRWAWTFRVREREKIVYGRCLVSPAAELERAATVTRAGAVATTGPGRPRKNASAPAPQASAPLAAPGLTRLPEPTVADVWLPGPRLLGCKDAARYVGVSTWTIRARLADGRLLRVKLPGAVGGVLERLLVDRLDLDRLIEAGKGR